MVVDARWRGVPDAAVEHGEVVVLVTKQIARARTEKDPDSRRIDDVTAQPRVLERLTGRDDGKLVASRPSAPLVAGQARDIERLDFGAAPASVARRVEQGDVADATASVDERRPRRFARRADGCDEADAGDRDASRAHPSNSLAMSETSCAFVAMPSASAALRTVPASRRL